MKKYLKWEFWPMWLFYLPVYVVYLWYSLRARSLFFFNAANPGMFMGGFVDYSKFDILRKIPTKVVPKTYLIEKDNALETIKKHLQSGDINYPFILKPDRGQRGSSVEKIKDEAELESYITRNQTNHNLQEFISTSLEFGVLYYRLPNEERGNISSVVQKVFLKVTGDGISDLKTLFKNSDRAQYYLDMLHEIYAEQLDDVLEKDKEMILLEVGNHCRGATFFNANHLINDRLVDTFDQISKQIDGFYFGRYDLKVETIEDLYAGNFKVVELNGANSEPAHIYDPEMPLFKAYGYMFKHWNTIFRISMQNNKKGYPFMKNSEGIAYVRNHYKRRKLETVQA